MVSGSNHCNFALGSLCRIDSASASWRPRPESPCIVYCRVLLKLGNVCLIDVIDSKKKKFQILLHATQAKSMIGHFSLHEQSVSICEVSQFKSCSNSTKNGLVMLFGKVS